jgi:ribosomal protein S8
MLAHDLCSALQNAFRARHSSIPLSHTKQTLGVLNILLQGGFIIAVTRGTQLAAEPQAFLEAGIAERRIWAQLKYRDDRPVLNAMSAVSKPSRRVFMDKDELRHWATGKAVNNIRPLGMGEIAVIKTLEKEQEWLEVREAIRLGLRGEVICRAM